MKELNYGIGHFKLIEVHLSAVEEYVGWIECADNFIDYHGRYEEDTNLMIKEILEESPEYDTESIFKYIHTVVIKPPEFIYTTITT